MDNGLNTTLYRIALMFCMVLVACSSTTPPSEPGATYTLSGKIKAATTESVAGITVSIGSASAVTDATGAYTFTGLANGTYVVAPAKTGLTFEPLTHSVTVNGANAVAPDFVVKTVRSYELPEMVAIEPGTFMMGAIVGQRGNPDFRPQHSVTITRGLWVGKYEVTQKQYESVMGVNPSEFKGDNRPATNMSMLDVVAFCNRLSELEGLTKAYVINGSNITWNRDANGYRLPTSAEWEYCARAGTTDNTYAGINDGKDPNPVLDAIAWYRTNSIDPDGNRSTRPVGQKQPNAWGLYDVLGNVSEYCFESSRSYTADPQIDPWSPFRGDSSIVRGANYTGTPNYVVVSNAFEYPIEGLVSSVNGLRLYRNR
jgi:formylglycine-generating enzyme required for sulfatase activity